MSEVSGGVILGKALKSLGVEVVFYLIGGPLEEMMWECSRQGIRLVDVRHEQAAAMMAHAYSRTTGKVGVCVTGPAPACINMATGVAVAFDDCAPVVAISGSATMDSRGKGAFEETNQVELMRPITKRAWEVLSPERIPDFIGMAFRHATGNKPGPVYLDLPADVLYGKVDEDRVRLPSLPKDIGRTMGDAKLVKEAMAILQRSERPIVIAGSGALWADAGPELQEFIEYTQIPVFTTPLARGLIPDDHSLCFPYARSFAWKEADTVLLIGSRTNFIIQHLLPPRFSKDLKVIMVNIDVEEIGHNRDADVGIVGDAKAVLRQFVEQMKAGFDSSFAKSWAKQVGQINSEKGEQALPQLSTDSKPIHPLRLCKEVRDFLPRDAILAVDGHMILNFARQSIPTYFPRHRLNPGPSGCMGVGIPFGIGAKLAKPDKQVLVLTGDGAFGMNGMEMDTAIRHGIQIIVVVSTNGSWAGMPSKWPSGYKLGLTRYDKVVEALGGAGYYVEEPDEIRPALDAALASGKPALVNVITAPVWATTQIFASYRASAI